MQAHEQAQPKWKRWIWPIAAGVLAAGLIVSIVLGVRASSARAQAQVELNSMYESAFDALCTNMSDINTAFAKLRVSTSRAQQAVLLNSIWRQAGQTAQAVSQLPVAHTVSGGILQYVNQVGDYCYVLAKRVERGGTLDESIYQTLQTLEEQTGLLAKQLEVSRENGVAWSELDQDMYAAIPDTEQLDELSQLAKSISQYPTLIYDGPFSERAHNIEPKAAVGDIVPYEQAEQVAQRFFPGTYTREEDEGGQVPTYNMRCMAENGESYQVRVTQKGGLLHSVLPVQATQTDILPNEEQVPQLSQTAKAFVEERGYPTMQPAYAQYYAGAAVVNLVPEQDGVLLYPDLVKVWVDVATMQVIGIDAHNYTVNHCTRSFGSPLKEQQSVRDRVATRLTIEGVRLVLIPTEELGEKLCYEWSGKNGEETFIVYTDALTGEEEEIKQILDAEDGTFVY